MYADLHLHTTASDGSWTPAQVVQAASERGFSVISITDHDTTDGVAEAQAAGTSLGLEVISGVEVSCENEDSDTEIHILGYYLEIDNPGLNGELTRFREARFVRAKNMVAALQEQGLNIEFERVLELSTDGSVGRPHIARALLEQGYVRSVQEAFHRYIGRDCPAYFPRYKLEPEKAIALIKEAGGVPVLAHPGLIGDDSLIPELVRAGIAGLEVYHSDHSIASQRRYKKMADDMGLLITGGSDCHGPKGKDSVLMGTVKLPFGYVKLLQGYRDRVIKSGGRPF